MTVTRETARLRLTELFLSTIDIINSWPDRESNTAQSVSSILPGVIKLCRLENVVCNLH